MYAGKHCAKAICPGKKKLMAVVFNREKLFTYFIKKISRSKQ